MHLWNTGGEEPRPSLIFCSNADLFLNDVAFDKVQARDKRKGSAMPSNRFIDVRLRIEATETIGSCGGKVSQGLACTLPEIPEKQAAFLRSCHDGSDLFVLWNVPCRQRTMIKPTACIVPYGLHCGASLCGTPASAWTEVVQAFRKPTSCAIDSIRLGT